MLLHPQRLLVSALLALLVCIPAAAQFPPDCTGISDVSDFDGATVSNMAGLLTSVRITSGLLGPVHIASAPGDTERLYVVEQRGTVRIIKNGSLQAGFFLDIQGDVYDQNNEEGLLSIAFHPDFQTNNWFFVYHTDIDRDGPGGESNGDRNLVARYTATDPDDADESTRKVIIEFDHDFATNHNGGQIAFSPDDGYLYIGTGDGGGGCDSGDLAQIITSDMGKLHRIDVDTDVTNPNYTVPADNPFAMNDTVWAYGLRNPWRFSFDRINGSNYIGDVGQFTWEEISCQVADRPRDNFGWDNWEGGVGGVESGHCPAPGCPSGGSCSIGAVPPISEFPSNNKTFGVCTNDTSQDCTANAQCIGGICSTPCSVTGGVSYRGCRMSDLHQTYFYSDYCAPFVRSFRTNDSCGVTSDLSRSAELDPIGGFSINAVTSYGEDARGEIYIVDQGGEIFKIIPILSIMEVSGDNAQQISVGDAWAWEDLESTSDHPVSSYKVYRADGDPTGIFSCVHESTAPGWGECSGSLADCASDADCPVGQTCAGGDPQTPNVGSPYYYLVTAVSSTTGEESRPGRTSLDMERDVDELSTCP